MAIDVIARGLATSLTDENGKIATNKMPTIEVNSTEGFTSIGKLTNPELINGRTSEEILLMMLFGIVNPVLTNPSLKIELDKTSTLIIGREQTLSGALSFDQGRIDPAYGTTGYRAGLPISYSIGDQEYKTNALTQKFSLTITPTSFENYIDYFVTHEAGEQPMNSIGKPVDAPYAAGIIFHTLYLSAVYPLLDAQGNDLEFTWFESTDGEGYQSFFASEGSGTKQSFALHKNVNVVGIKAYDSLTKDWSWLGGEGAEDSLDYFTRTEVNGLQVFTHNHIKVGERELRIYVANQEV